jgi:hypothetical protein
MNAWNKRFWAKQARLTRQRITDPICYAAAKRDMDSEAIRVAIRERKSLEQALSDAQETVREAEKLVRRNVINAERERRRNISRSGGLAPKPDPLQILIQQLVREMPTINRRGLWFRLKDELGRGIIVAIDRKEIRFLTPRCGLKTAPVSGLKDRLHRAKREKDSL